LNKEGLISSLAEISGLSKSDSIRALDGMIQSMQMALKEGKKVTLTGFGTFNVIERAATKGRNPRTGESIEIPSKKVLKFSAGKTLKEAIS
jgi:DNA-binding protein HU-beta